MIFNWVEFKNFKSYGDYDTRINLNFTGTKFLVGINGAGKTTVADAIIFCLFGRTITNMDGIVNRQTKKNCKVELDFSVEKYNYSVIRYRNHEEYGNDLMFFQDGKPKTLKKINDTQSLINETVGFDYNAVISTIIYSSELYVSFLRSQPSARMKIFESILPSLSIVQDYYSIIKKLRKPIQDEFDIKEQEYSNRNVQIKTVLSNVNSYKENAKAKLIKFKKEKEELEDDLKIIQSKITSLNEIDIETEIVAAREYAKISEENSIVQEQIDDKKLFDIDSLANQLHETKSKIDKISIIDFDKEKNEIKEYERLVKQNEEVKNRIKLLEKEIVSISNLEKSRERLENSKTEIHLEIVKMENNPKKCYACGHVVTDKFIEAELKKRKEKLNKIEDELLTIEENIKNTALNNDRAQSEIGELKSIIQDLSIKPTYTLEQLSTYENEIGILKERVNNIESEIESKSSLNKEIKDKLKELKSKLREAPGKPNYALDYLEKINETITEYRKEQDDIVNKILSINEKAKTTYDKTFVEKSIKETEGLKKINNKLEKEIIKIKHLLTHYDFEQQLFSNKEIGIKKFIIDKMVDSFNKMINSYTKYFFNEDIQVFLDKDLKEFIIIDGAEVAFDAFSSGEKTRLDLSVSFTMFDLVKSFFFVDVNLLLFDEILDKNIDEVGMNAVIEILNRLSENNAIIVVSHRDEYKSYFQDRILFYKDESGFSRIEVA